MNYPQSPPRNNYASVHTPIASAKRPKNSGKVDLRSPQPLDFNNARTNDSEKPIIDKLADMHVASPSKNLFSPYLKYDDTDKSNGSSPVRNLEESFESAELSENDDDSRDDDDDEVFNPYLFMASLPAYDDVQSNNKIWLPPSFNHSTMTLVLDLDETLVHCKTEPIPNPDFVFPVIFNGMDYQIYGKKRPFLEKFLDIVSQRFEVVLFTASNRVYADMLINKLDVDRKWFRHRLFREACLFVEDNYLKDLNVLGRNLSKTVLVDNSPYAYAYHIDNGIPIVSWYDDPNDTELLKLLGYLDRIHDVDDVRPHIRNHFKTHRLISDAKRGIPFSSLITPPF